MSEYYSYEDILEARKRGLKGIQLKKYDPLKFWESIGPNYYAQFTKREQIQVYTDWLSDRLKLFKLETLLDVGCGFGRVLPFLLFDGVVQKAHGVDICEAIIKSAEEYLKPVRSNEEIFSNITRIYKDDALPLEVRQAIFPVYEKFRANIEARKNDTLTDYREKIKLEVGDARELKFENNSFDAVIACELLTHICPGDVHKVAGELNRVASKVVVLVERWSFPGEHSEPHIWSHDLANIFTSIGANVAQVTTVGNGLQGVVIVK